MATGRGDRVEGGDKKQTLIRFRSYNIRNRQNDGLESALRGFAQDNMDIGVIHETKVIDRVYTSMSDGYIVVAMDALQWSGSVIPSLAEVLS